MTPLIVTYRFGQARKRSYMEWNSLVLVGYMRVSKSDGSHVLDVQRNALLTGSATPERLYKDRTSDKRATLALWKPGRLEDNLRHPVNSFPDLAGRGGSQRGQPSTKTVERCAELGVTHQTLYRHIDSTGELPSDDEKLLGRQGCGTRPAGQTTQCSRRHGHTAP